MQLSDFESTRKSADTGDYLDLCNLCFAPIASTCRVIERYDLIQADDLGDANDVPEET